MPMKMEQTECSETSEYKIQTPVDYPEEERNIQNLVRYGEVKHIDTNRRDEIK
jgi:hypothetical protein